MILKAAVAAAIATLVAQRVTAAPLPESDVTTKIVGGNVAPNGAFPFIVSLSSGGKHFCGGSLLNEEYVLTASHCLFNPPPNIQVRAGSNDRTTGGMVVNGVDPKTHPGFTMEGLDNDVALLRLSPPINKSANIDFVKMPQKNSDPQEGTKTVAGWGYLREQVPVSPEDLRQVSFPLIPRDQCNQRVQSLTGKRITENMICAGNVGQDSCSGDSGGPLIDAQTGVLQGVVSFGFGCANQQLPGVYARVDTQLDFIQSAMNGQSPTPPGPPSQPPGGNPGNPPPGPPSQPPGGNPGNPPSGPPSQPPGSNPGNPGVPGDGSFPGFDYDVLVQIIQDIIAGIYG
ncbi:hypothetical protein BB8028_0001g15830 [Beauveria bassiana]|uniref:Peptidase S1 domain-containing protein n=1 Tax=Beauveria bassiana TaxID=176275 RepID=A0A2S7Y0Q5_BEABA|nr:hypothetical protein BB8028_0001g15830 [Beauveria bassiana]